MKNIAQLFLKKTREFFNNPAYVEILSDRAKKEQSAARARFGYINGEYVTYTYGEVREMVLILAEYLKQQGFNRDSKIGLLAGNSVLWCIVYFTGQCMGIPVVPLDTNLHPRDNIHFLRHSKVDVLFTDSDYYDQMDLELARGLNIKQVILMDDFNDIKKTKSLKNIITADKEVNEDIINSENIDSKDISVILYTSGTTGSPKGVCLTHGNLMHQAVVLPETIEYNSKDVFIGILPLFHTFPATVCMIAPLTIGCKVVFAGTLKATKLVEIMKDQAVTIMIGVPALFESIKNAIVRKARNSSLPKKVGYNISMGVTKLFGKLGVQAGSALFSSLREKAGMANLRLMVSGGAPLFPETGEFYRLIGIEFIQGYGLTETSPVVSASSADDPLDSVGHPIKGVDVKISNPNKDGVGEIEVRGPNVMPGYYKNPEATKKVMMKGWFKTGDLGFVDKRGLLYIKGRKKNVIVKSGGKNVYPEEIEEVLLESPYILESLVYGRVSGPESKGESVEAFIYPNYENLDIYFEKRNIDETEEKVREIIDKEIKRLTQDFPAYKKIRDFKIQQEEFEKTTTRKIKRYLYTNQ